MIYLPDTNAFSAHLRGKAPALSARMKTAAEAGELRLSVMVLAELEFGARKAERTLGTSRFVERVKMLKRAVEPETIGMEFCAAYALVRDTLEAAGQKIGDRDTIIAAHALSLGATLITANVDEFRRVPGLKLENWAN
ncbi:MAG: PIN domain-containing protein [Opitutaceae bacterium]|nr:PIN domain-containing protein [Opitutaceae bacterium]